MACNFGGETFVSGSWSASAVIVRCSSTPEAIIGGDQTVVQLILGIQFSYPSHLRRNDQEGCSRNETTAYKRWLRLQGVRMANSSQVFMSITKGTI